LGGGLKIAGLLQFQACRIFREPLLQLTHWFPRNHSI